MDQRCTTMTKVFVLHHACLCPNSCENNDARQMRMIDQETRHKCTNWFHIPRKTGEEQLLLLTVPTLRQRTKTNPVPQYLAGPIRTACSRKRATSSPDNAGSVKLIYVLKLDVAQMSPHVVNNSQSRAANVSSNAPMAAPRQDAMPHVRFRLVARQDSEQPQTATHHTIKCGCDTEPTILQIMLPAAASPSKRQERGLHEK